MAALVAALPAIAETAAQMLASFGVSKLFDKATTWFNNRDFSGSLDAVKNGARAFAHKAQVELGRAKQHVSDNDWLGKAFGGGNDRRMARGDYPDYQPTQFAPLSLGDFKPPQQQFTPVSASDFYKNRNRGEQHMVLPNPKAPKKDLYSSDTSRRWSDGLGSPGNRSQFGNTNGDRFVEPQVPKIVPAKRPVATNPGGTIPPPMGAQRLVDYGSSQFGFSTGGKNVEPQAPFAILNPTVVSGTSPFIKRGPAKLAYDIPVRPETSMSGLRSMGRQIAIGSVPGPIILEANTVKDILTQPAEVIRAKKVIRPNITSADVNEIKEQISRVKHKAKYDRLHSEADAVRSNVEAKAKIEHLKRKQAAGALTKKDKVVVRAVKKGAR